MAKKLSVIVPAYSEEKRIGPTLEKMDKFFSTQNYDYEILVVIDGAKDRTLEVVNSYISKVKNLTVLDNKENHGKGWVVRQGMLKAAGEYRLFTDADNSTDIEQVNLLWPFLESGQFQVAIGSIEAEGAKVQEHAQWYRRTVGHWAKFLIRFVAGLWSIKDTQRGFKLFTAQAAQDIFSRAVVDRFGFDIEVLALAKKLGYKIKEVAVVWENAGDSTVSAGAYIQVFKDLFLIRWRLWTGKYK